MIKRITITTPDGKSTTKEFKTRDLSHLESCIKYHSTVTRNKKKYTRKEKHKTMY